MMKPKYVAGVRWWQPIFEQSHFLSPLSGSKLHSLNGTLFSSHSSHSQLMRVNALSAVRPLCTSLWSWTCKSSPQFLGFGESLQLGWNSCAYHDISTCWGFGEGPLVICYSGLKIIFVPQGEDFAASIEHEEQPIMSILSAWDSIHVRGSFGWGDASTARRPFWEDCALYICPFKSPLDFHIIPSNTHFMPWDAHQIGSFSSVQTSSLPLILPLAWPLQVRLPSSRDFGVRWSPESSQTLLGVARSRRPQKQWEAQDRKPCPSHHHFYGWYQPSPNWRFIFVSHGFQRYVCKIWSWTCVLWPGDLVRHPIEWCLKVGLKVSIDRTQP